VCELTHVHNPQVAREACQGAQSILLWGCWVLAWVGAVPCSSCFGALNSCIPSTMGCVTL
jgi:hypothetical protein